MGVRGRSCWGGFVTGDEITVNWDGNCGCGRKGEYLHPEIRRFSDKYTTDDGTEIESYVLIGPFKLGNGYVKEGSLEEMVATLNYYSGSVDWSLQVGKTAQDAILATTLDSGTWDEAEGLQLTDRPRVRGESCVLRLDNAGLTPWAMEDIAVLVETLDDQRML